MAHIITETRGFTGIITLNHDEKRNALSEAFVYEIIAAFRDFRRQEVRAIILRARPGKQNKVTAEQKRIFGDILVEATDRITEEIVAEDVLEGENDDRQIN